MDPLQLRSILWNAASDLFYPLCILWDENALASITMSLLLEQMFTEAISADLRDTFEF